MPRNEILGLAGSIVSLVSKGTIPVPVNSCLGAALFFVQTGAAICAISASALLVSKLPCHRVWFFVWFPVLAILIFLCAGIVFAALVDPLIEDENREWWARSAGYLILLTLGWLCLTLLSVGVPIGVGAVPPRTGASNLLWFSLPTRLIDNQWAKPALAFLGLGI